VKRIVTTVCLLAAFLVTFVTVALATTNTPTYHRTVRGNDSVSIPDPHCQTVTSHAYHLRTCLDITTRGDWTPTPLPPGIGGLQGAATHVFGRIRVTYGYSNAAVVPYKVKLWVGNLTNGKIIMLFKFLEAKLVSRVCSP
jgi:hypothetical protein